MQVRDMMVSLGEGASVEVRRIRHEGQGQEGRPTLVFLHESLGSIALWRRFPERLAKATGYDALIYNRLGYGHSSDEPLPRPYDYQEKEGEVLLPALLDALGLDDVVLIGHSDGGSIALIAAGALGARVRALVTMAAHIYADHLTIAGIREMASRYRETDIRDKLQRYHGDRTDDLFNAWQTVWLDEGFQNHMDFDRWLAAIQCPSIIIQGQDDEYGVPEQVTDIVAGIGASAEAVFLPEVGHSPHLEKPDKVHDLVCDFLLRTLA
ncbi:alpha/beta hydrolase [Marinobacter sp. M216]|uniref:Alpha/beta hydrolase n=1 Tax=Marinobacter albus TaxID=3030833 RepID=A0ABT7HFK6_9GAMM|nr:MULTISPECIES: alpha/beta hydrolase [unclassified Marinobacter]MBW7472601.1 alpha/beta hydrolase [Marinobacter sp. F4218]MDK9559154.1 alpha/beta hydrolase [Marinobacter sp. M216]